MHKPRLAGRNLSDHRYSFRLHLEPLEACLLLLDLYVAESSPSDHERFPPRCASLPKPGSVGVSLLLNKSRVSFALLAASQLPRVSG